MFYEPMQAATGNADARVGAWTPITITMSNVEGPSGRRKGWLCPTCGLIIGGAPAKVPLDECPICAARRGQAVAVLVRGREDLAISTFVVDAQFQQLIDSYDEARKVTAIDDAEESAVSVRGNYDVDGDTSSPATEAHRASEHRLALALADATLARSR